MHLAEGVITSPAVLGAGWAVACGGVALGLARLNEAQTMRAAVMSSSFFVASLVHIPVFGISIHLTLTGVLGIVLGWAAFPAVFVALILQAVLFGFGGFTTLGLNTCIMAIPAVLVFLSFRSLRISPESPAIPAICGLLGAIAIMIAALLLAGILSTAGDAFRVVALSAILAQLPVTFLEGFVTAAAVSFLKKVYPELLTGAAIQSDNATPDLET